MRKNGGATDINENLNDIKNVTATVVEGAAAVIIANVRWVPGTGTPVLQGGTRPRGSVARGREGGRRAVGSARKGPHQSGCHGGRESLERSLAVVPWRRGRLGRAAVVQVRRWLVWVALVVILPVFLAPAPGMVRCWQGKVGVVASPVVAWRAAVLGLIQGSWGWAGIWWGWLPVVVLGVAGRGPVELGLGRGQGRG